MKKIEEKLQFDPIIRIIFYFGIFFMNVLIYIFLDKHMVIIGPMNKVGFLLCVIVLSILALISRPIIQLIVAILTIPITLKSLEVYLGNIVNYIWKYYSNVFTR